MIFLDTCSASVLHNVAGQSSPAAESKKSVKVLTTSSAAVSCLAKYRDREKQCHSHFLITPCPRVTPLRRRITAASPPREKDTTTDVTTSTVIIIY